MRRVWINQPSTLQVLHHLHGVEVLAEDTRPDGTVRIWFLQGAALNQEAFAICLSNGWPKAGKMPKPGFISDPAADPANTAAAHGITTKGGLLYRDGKCIDLPEADSVARQYGFHCAENMVEALENGETLYLTNPEGA